MVMRYHQTPDRAESVIQASHLNFRVYCCNMRARDCYFDMQAGYKTNEFPCSPAIRAIDSVPLAYSSKTHATGRSPGS